MADHNIRWKSPKPKILDNALNKNAQATAYLQQIRDELAESVKTYMWGEDDTRMSVTDTIYEEDNFKEKYRKLYILAGIKNPTDMDIMFTFGKDSMHAIDHFDPAHRKR